jgi:beta-galactosidase
MKTFFGLHTTLFLFAFAANLAAAEPVQRLSDGWEYYQGSLGSTWEIWRGEKASDNVTWSKVTLPHCFNAHDAVDPDEHYYQGPGWYRMRLKVANPFPNGRTLLHFDGAGQKAEVFVYTEKVGEHVGGYDQWTVDITDAAKKAQKNKSFKDKTPLAVRCDNSRDAESIPSDLSDFNRYGGLYRHVSLAYVPAISLERVHVEPILDAKNNKATVKVRCRLYDPTALKDEVELALEVLDPKGKVVHRATKKLVSLSGEKEIDAFDIAQPELWSPKTPALYRCTATLKSKHGEQNLAERFGVRSFEWVEHGPFKLNGERLLLRGTHYHEDHAGVAAAIPDDVVQQTMKMMKEMGANFVRLGHYQQAPLVLDLCDELGLLVWEEVAWCRGGLGGEKFQKQGRDMLRNMIDQHYNHPSVILWGLGNENDWPGDFEVFDKQKIRAFMAEQNKLAHELDPSRFTCIRRCDFCKDIVDVYSPSIWAGWYSGRYTEHRAAIEKAIKDTKHFFLAEWGGDSHAGRFAEEPEKILGKIATGQGTAEKGTAYKLTGGNARMARDGDWSENYICNLFDWCLKEQEEMPQLTGAAQWIFKDFSTPLRPENPVPRMNQKGVIERDGTPKESYYVFQSFWSEKPMLRLFGHKWAVRWGAAGEAKEVRVYSNCPEAELFVNGKSAGVKQRKSADFPAAGLRWNVKLEPGKNALRAVGHRDGIEVSDEIAVEYRTEKWGKPAKLTLEEISRKDSVATVEARLFDAKGVECFDAANLVRFGLTGEGILLDNLGTSTGSRVVQLCNGRARIGVRLTGYQACVSVSSEGLKPAFCFVGEKTAAAVDKAKKITVTVKTVSETKPTASKLTLDVAGIDRDRILRKVAAALKQEPLTITAFPAKLSQGGPNDYYSNGDYWWPDPRKADGLPYIRRDGETNPENFSKHRLAVKQMRDSVAALAAAYKLTGEDRYAVKTADLLRVFFVDPKTRMNPNLNYAQAIPGVSPGRGIGIIDTLQLIEVPISVRVLEKSAAFPPKLGADLRQWFRDYAQWMTTSKNGQEESRTKNNHAVAFYLQLAVFSVFVGDEAKLAECRRQYKEVFVAKQMAADGSFPEELARTKPYGYSIFQLDNMSALCQVLSRPGDDLWSFETADGRGIRKAVAWLYPFLADKSKWKRKPDVQAWESWPARQPCLLFAGLALGEQSYLDLWKKLPPDPTDEEVQRNITVTQPLLWLK